MPCDGMLGDAPPGFRAAPRAVFAVTAIRLQSLMSSRLWRCALRLPLGIGARPISAWHPFKTTEPACAGSVRQAPMRATGVSLFFSTASSSCRACARSCLERVHDLSSDWENGVVRTKRYPSDISRELFEPVRPLLEQARRKTKPRTVDLYNLDSFPRTGIRLILKRSGMRSYPRWRSALATNRPARWVTRCLARDRCSRGVAPRR